MRSALASIKYREAVIYESKHRCDPSYGCKDIFDVWPGMVDSRRAATPELRSPLLRVKKHLPQATLSGTEDAFGREGEVPTEGTPLLFMAAQSCGDGAPA